MRSNTAILITIALLLSSGGAIAASGTTDAAAKIAKTASCDAFSSSVWGLLAVTEDGDTLACFNHMQRMVPASNMKLLTTGMALRTLGADFRFSTSIAISGEVKDGVLDGDVYIIGGGDPSTADTYKATRPAASMMTEWMGFLTAAGIREVRGNVIGDPRFFDGEDARGDWTGEDTGFDYGSAVTGLNWYSNCHAFLVSPADSVGGLVKFESIYPELPWMKYSFRAVTADRNTADLTHLVNTDMAPVAEMRGTFPIGRGRTRTFYSNRFGAYTCAHEFYKFLNSKGVKVCGTWADVTAGGLVREDLNVGGRCAAASSLAILGTTYSRPLSELAGEANHESDNFYTEAFFRMLGRVKCGSAAPEASVKTLKTILSGFVPLHSGVRVADGCGLSRKNYVSPDFMVSFLRRMMDEPVFPVYLETLPNPGEGSLKNRFPKADPAFKSRIFMKSGSMNGVRCFSGYILPSEGGSGKKIVFSVMTNNATASSRVMYPLLEQMIAALAAEN